MENNLFCTTANSATFFWHLPETNESTNSQDKDQLDDLATQQQLTSIKLLREGQFLVPFVN